MLIFVRVYRAFFLVCYISLSLFSVSFVYRNKHSLLGKTVLQKYVAKAIERKLY